MIFFLFLPIHLYRFSRCFHFVVMPREARIIKCLVTVTLPRMKPRPVRYPLRCLPEFVCGQIKPANPWLSRVIRNLPLLPKKKSPSACISDLRDRLFRPFCLNLFKLRFLSVWRESGVFMHGSRRRRWWRRGKNSSLYDRPNIRRKTRVKIYISHSHNQSRRWTESLFPLPKPRSRARGRKQFRRDWISGGGEKAWRCPACSVFRSLPWYNQKSLVLLVAHRSCIFVNLVTYREKIPKNPDDKEKWSHIRVYIPKRK